MDEEFNEKLYYLKRLRNMEHKGACIDKSFSFMTPLDEIKAEYDKQKQILIAQEQEQLRINQINSEIVFRNLWQNMPKPP